MAARGEGVTGVLQLGAAYGLVPAHVEQDGGHHYYLCRDSTAMQAPLPGLLLLRSHCHAGPLAQQ